MRRLRREIAVDNPARPPQTAGRAQVAELVDALVSGTSGASRGGSSPLLGTRLSSLGAGQDNPARARFGVPDGWLVISSNKRQAVHDHSVMGSVSSMKSRLRLFGLAGAAFAATLLLWPSAAFAQFWIFGPSPGTRPAPAAPPRSGGLLDEPVRPPADIGAPRRLATPAPKVRRAPALARRAKPSAPLAKASPADKPSPADPSGDARRGQAPRPGCSRFTVAGGFASGEARIPDTGRGDAPSAARSEPGRQSRGYIRLHSCKPAPRTGLSGSELDERRRGSGRQGFGVPRRPSRRRVSPRRAIRLPPCAPFIRPPTARQRRRPRRNRRRRPRGCGGCNRIVAKIGYRNAGLGALGFEPSRTLILEERLPS